MATTCIQIPYVRCMHWLISVPLDSTCVPDEYFIERCENIKFIFSPALYFLFVGKRRHPQRPVPEVILQALAFKRLMAVKAGMHEAIIAFINIIQMLLPKKVLMCSRNISRI